MNADGFVNKYKARLVAQGNHQDSSTYFDTFADTASARTINILLGIATSENLDISTIDVKTAFLYSPIKETIYLKRPPGLSPNIMPNIVKLNVFMDYVKLTMNGEIFWIAPSKLLVLFNSRRMNVLSLIHISEPTRPY